ncbi:cell division protein [Lactobacillus mulieris]|uniref:cell division protein n=1 Tax=Lactobacillus mulieris TaxID=2508708 RepID=UPI0014329B63|nr:cell division protein [Lactobacillus mulieris]MDK6803627.1 cell division protein [Lactobacillus mulieris]MDK8382819.1 cell division protein [Lactobacillus mulieris]MDT9620970.1 cell division protein [Lactobacillus mulieris]NKC41980.1 cell division protein [Lactobacillus mulieris]
MKKWASFPQKNMLVSFLLITLLSLILTYYQFRYKAVFVYNDTAFHYNRYFDIFQQFKTGNFSYFQTNYGFCQSGRIINAVYGPGFAYLNGLLLFICKSWFSYQLTTIFLLNYLAGYGYLFLCKKIKVKPIFAYLTLPLFLLGGYFPTWIQGNTLMSWGQALCPWIIAEGINFITKDPTELSSFKLGIWMAVVAQIHNLTLLMLGLVLLYFAIIGFFKFKNRFVLLKRICTNIGVFLLLSLNVIGGILVLFNNKIAMPVGVALNEHVLHFSSFDYSITNFSYLFVVLLVLQILFTFYNIKENKLNFEMTILCVLLILFASRLFPWSFFDKHFPNLQNSFQAPTRLVILIYPLFLSIIALSLSILSKKGRLENGIKYVILLVICLFTLVQFNQRRISQRNSTLNYLNDKTVVNYSFPRYISSDRIAIREALHSENKYKFLTLFINSEPDYLPINEQTNAISSYGKYIIDQYKHFNHKVLSDGTLQLRWKANKNEKVILPIVVYKQSMLVVNGKRNVKYLKGLNVPIVYSKNGINVANLKFITPLWFVIILWITIISWIVVFGYLIYKSVRKCRLFC